MTKRKREQHGMTNTRIYRIWKRMRSRCSNPNCWNYKYYGGRGITVCSRWDSFITFYNDMKENYTDHLTIDRKNNNKGYEPSNCQWVSRKEQVLNQRYYSKLTKQDIDTIHQLLYEGNLTQKEIGSIFNITQTAISRIKTGNRWKNK